MEITAHIVLRREISPFCDEPHVWVEENALKTKLNNNVCLRRSLLITMFIFRTCCGYQSSSL